jgi:hypothetical protein
LAERQGIASFYKRLKPSNIYTSNEISRNQNARLQVLC